MSDTGPPNLDQAMNEQRLQEDADWKEIAARAGLSEYHLQRIRSGKTALTERAAAKIDKAMKWKPGSAWATYYENGSPTPLRFDPPQHADAEAAMLDELGINPRNWRRVPQSTRDAITTAWRVDRERRARETHTQRGA